MTAAARHPSPMEPTDRKTGEQWRCIREMNALLPHELFVEIGDVFLQQTTWLKETLDALVFIRRMRPGQESEAMFCHDQLVRTLEHWYRTAGFCYDEFPPLLLHLSNYLMAAGYRRRDGEWVAPTEEGA